MKEIVVSLLVMAALAAGSWVYLGHYLPARPAPAVESSASGETAAALPKTAPKHSTPRTPHLRPVPEEVPEYANAAAQVDIALPEKVAPPEKKEEEARPRPVAPNELRAVAVGMEEEDVVRLLGKPVLTTLTSHSGSRDEGLVYNQTKGWPQVVIHVSDGKVVGSPQ